MNPVQNSGNNSQNPLDQSSSDQTQTQSSPVETTQSPVIPTTPAPESQPTTPFAQDFTSNTPQVVQSQVLTPPETPPEAPKSRKKLFLFLILLFFFLLLIGAGGVTYAVAYEKIKLEKYPDVQKKVSAFVQSIPFMPKTPKFLLAKSALAHQEVTKQSFDVSIAVDSADLASSFGLTTIDAKVAGAVDYSDPKNVIFFMDASVTKDFNFELRKKDKFLYFKINKLPALLLAFMGLKTETFTPLLEKWVSYDTTPLDTEARRSIQDQEIDPLSQEFIDENFNKYIDEEVLGKMVLESVTEEGMEMYKITLTADSDLIDHLGDKLEAERSKQSGATLQSQDEKTKLSDMVKKLKWEIFIDKKDYYMRKLVIVADLEVDNSSTLGSPFLGTSSSLSEKSKATFAFAFKSGKFGEEVVVEVPASAMTFEEFTNLISEIVAEAYGDLMAPETLPDASPLDTP